MKKNVKETMRSKKDKDAGNGRNRTNIFVGQRNCYAENAIC